MFSKYLIKAIQTSGIDAFKVNPRLFVGYKGIYISYVDNILFRAIDENYINELTERLLGQGLLLEQQDDATAFL